MLEVLAQRTRLGTGQSRAHRGSTEIAVRARRSAAAVTSHVEVRTLDAGVTDAYLGAVPAEVVLLVGILGNISDGDLARTINHAPALCRPAATPLWSRARARGDLNDCGAVRRPTHALARRQTSLHLPALNLGASVPSAVALICGPGRNI